MFFKVLQSLSDRSHPRRSGADSTAWEDGRIDQTQNLGVLRPTPACFCAAAAAEEGERQPLIHQHKDEQDSDNPSSPDKSSTVTQIILLHFMIKLHDIDFLYLFFFFEAGFTPREAPSV